MTELEMLRHLLNKSGRIFYEITDSHDRVTIQVSFSDFRQQWDFDTDGNLTAEWVNSNPSTWIWS